MPSRRFAQIRSGLEEHMAWLGPQAVACYLLLHLKATGTGPAAGTVRITEREVARVCGMSTGAAHAAMARLQPRYITRLESGLYRIERFGAAVAHNVSNADSSGGGHAQNVSGLLTLRASCSEYEHPAQNVSSYKELDGDGRREEKELLASAAPTPATEANTTGTHADPGHETQSAAKRGRGTSRPSREEATPDARHGPVREAIRAAYRAACGAEAPWDGLAARRLAEALKAAPAWTAADWLACVEHRYASEDAPPSEPPAAWVRQMARYRAGPLDRFARVRPKPVGASPAEPSEPGIDTERRERAARLKQAERERQAARAAQAQPQRTLAVAEEREQSKAAIGELVDRMRRIRN